MKAVRITWTIMSILLTLLLISKIIMAAWLGNPVTVLPQTFGIFALFYLIFLEEGLQVAGLQVKDLDRDAMIQAVENHPVVGLREVLPLYNTFHANFDGFVTGRQLFTIGSVVGLSFLLKSLSVPPDSGIETGQAFFSNLTVFLNGGLFAFICSTLLPAWWCQLLSQFIADGRATTFLDMPGARLVLRGAMLLDKIELGAPAHSFMDLLTRGGWIGERQVIPVGKGMYYESSLNFYGRAKKQHDIALMLGTPSTVRETISYVLKRVKTDYLVHKIQLSSPILGDIKGKIKLPEDVYCELAAHDATGEKAQNNGKGEYLYWVRIDLNQPLPREGVESDDVVLEIEYQTNAYTENTGASYTTEFHSSLPTKDAKICIQGGNKLLKKPRVRIVEEVNGEFSPVQQQGEEQIWTISTPVPEKNIAEIQLEYPPPAVAYQVEFASMEKNAASPDTSVIQNDVPHNGQAFLDFTIKLPGSGAQASRITRGVGDSYTDIEVQPGTKVITSKHIGISGNVISGRHGG